MHWPSVQTLCHRTHTVPNSDVSTSVSATVATLLASLSPSVLFAYGVVRLAASFVRSTMLCATKAHRFIFGRLSAWFYGARVCTATFLTAMCPHAFPMLYIGPSAPVDLSHRLTPYDLDMFTKHLNGQLFHWLLFLLLLLLLFVVYCLLSVWVLEREQGRGCLCDVGSIRPTK